MLNLFNPSRERDFEHSTEQNDLIQLYKKIVKSVNNPGKTAKQTLLIVKDFEEAKIKKNKDFKIENIINLPLYSNDEEYSFTIFGALVVIFNSSENRKKQDKIFKILEFFIQNGADINLTSMGYTSLFNAINYDNFEIASFLLKQKDIERSVNKISLEGVTSLYLAVQKGNVEIVKALIDKGADVCLTLRTDGSSPLIVSAELGNLEILKLLTSERVLSHYKDLKNDVGIALYTALQNSRGESLVNELLSINGIDKNHIPRLTGAHAIHVASQMGNVKIFELLLKNGVDINLLSSEGSSPFHVACLNGHLDIVKILIKHPNVQINAKIEEGGATPLILASQNGNSAIVQLLIDDERLDQDYSEATNVALTNGHFSIVSKLISKFPNVKLLATVQVEQLENHSIDSIELYRSFKNLFDILVDDEKKAEFLSAQVDGKTILQHAITNNSFEIAKLIFNEIISLHMRLQTSEDEIDEFRVKTFLDSISNIIYEAEYFEFIKTVCQDQEDEILKSITIQFPKLQEFDQPELSDIWNSYRSGDLQNIKKRILEDPSEITMPKYKERSVEEVKISPKTLLHRLAEDGDENSVDILKTLIRACEFKNRLNRRIQSEIYYNIEAIINSTAKIEYREKKENRGFIKGVTPLYIAVNKQNLDVINVLTKYADFDCELTKIDNNENKTRYSIFELALEMACSKNGNLLKGIAILNILTGENEFEKKAKFPESKIQKDKIAKKFHSFPHEIKEILLKQYPEEQIEERAKRILESQGEDRAQTFSDLPSSMMSLRFRAIDTSVERRVTISSSRA